MTVTEVWIKLVGGGDRLHAFASVTFDDEFVVRDLKLISGTAGMFVAMPSRKLTDKCPQCRAKTGLQDKFCLNCGLRLDPSRATPETARVKLHADVAHPINAACRIKIQDAVLEAYRLELERSKEPGYVNEYDSLGETV